MTKSPVTLITGGSAGIGEATARQLLERGHRVTITGRNQDRLDQAVERLGAPKELAAFAGDAADWDAVNDAVTKTVETFGQLDAVVANAGYATHDGLAAGDPAGWRDMVLTNVLGPALLIRAALPHVKTTGGRIVLVGSVAGLIHTPANIYGATKWAVTGLAENTRLMAAADGVGVTLISPGGTETEFFDPMGGPPPGRRGGYLAVDNVAAAIVWALTQPDGVDISSVTVRAVGSPV
jgi:NADP-dependent 3-hydroxy acid dehydrogenase YdfG